MSAAVKPDAAPALSAGGWKAEVHCVGCKYWRTLDPVRHWMACHYPIDTPYLRPCDPKDCYRHAGTPYTPEQNSKEG